MHDQGGVDPSLAVAYGATRQLFRVTDTSQVLMLLIDLCRDLGADVVPADANNGDALPIDLTLGEGDALVPASSDPFVRRNIQRYVIPAVADARLVLERDQASNRMAHLATRDTLTGLWNRHSIDLAVDRARPGDCLAMVDLDHFKRINDVYGHAEGDEVLRAFAEHLRRTVRDKDIVGRHGGEEFIVLLPETDLDDARAALERIQQRWASNAPFDISFSAGIAGVDPAAVGTPTAGRAALRWADAALYQAKADGRDRVVCASP